MTLNYLPASHATYRNFNLCPHCAYIGQPPLLCRMCEGLPMISRSDGKNFHLLLADHPLPYPIERAAGATKNISVCFWYKHVREPKTTFSIIVILPHSQGTRASVFRAIEVVADLLAEELAQNGCLAEFYELVDHSKCQPS